MYKKKRCSGFTLIELLVVVAVIAMLLSVIIPVMGKVKEKSRRVLCQNNVRLFYIGLTVYANNHNQTLPSDFPSSQVNHTLALSPQCRDTIIRLIGHNKLLECPSLGGPFKNADGWKYEGVGCIIGYNYLGGHPETPWPIFPGYTAWTSPQKITERPNQPIVTELNAWITYNGEKRTFAPHGVRGPITRFAEKGQGGFPSAQAGAVGGNYCLLDGSIGWKDIGIMRMYRASAYGDVCSTVW